MSKITVVGAGQVGSAIAYTLAFEGVADRLTLIDKNADRARAEELDISHALPLLRPVKVESGGYPAMEGSDVVVIAAGASQSPGESRRDLAGRNRAILEEIAPNIARYAPGCVVIVVTNPLDYMVKVVLDATGFPKERVIGSGTALDTARFRWMLSNHTGIDARNIHAYVIGEHGDSSIPVWSSLSIAGMKMGEFCRGGWCGEENPDEGYDRLVRDIAYEIIEKKGSTNYAIACVTQAIARSILRGEHAVFTLSTLLTGQYGIRDVCMSLPTVVGRGGVERVLEIALSEEERVMLNHAADVIRMTEREIVNA